MMAAAVQPTAATARFRHVGTSYAWYVAILLALAHLVSFVDRFVMSLVLVPLKQDFGLSDTQLGLLHGTGFVILYTVAAIPLGRVADIGNRRNLIVAGLVFWSLATAACGLANSFGTLFAARIGVGLGEASLVPAAMSLIAAYFHREQVARAVSVFTTGAGLGKSAALIIGGVLLAWLVARGGLSLPLVGTLKPWQGLFVLFALPGFALAALFLTVEEPARSNTGLAKPSFGAAFSYILARKAAYVTHTTAAACAIALVQGVAAWAPTYFVRLFDMTPAQAGVLVGTTFLITGPMGALSSGYVTDKLQSAGVRGAPGLMIAIALILAIPCAVLFAVTRDLRIAVVGYGALSFFLAASAPPGLAGVQMFTPDRLRGVVTALFLCIVTFFAVGFGPTLIGMVTDRVFGSPQALHWSLLTVILVLGSIGAAFALISRGPTSRAQLSPATVLAMEIP